MELYPRTPGEQSSAPLEYQSLQRKDTSLGYYNVGLKTEKTRKSQQVYEEVGCNAEA